MAKKVIKKYQGNTGSSTTGPATNGPKAQSRSLYRRTPPPPPDTRSTNEKVGITRPNDNKPAVSPIRQLKKGGTIKKKK
jgi:hypothetical protein